VGTFAISAYDVSLFLHITAVVVGFGATFAESIMFPVAMKLDPRHLPYVHRLQMAINQWFATPALVVARDVQAAGDGPVTLSTEYQKGARIEGAVGGLTGLLLVVAIFLMVVKPGA
jgi:hypothetical protein